MLTICWAAKGGSGTTVVAATLALAGGVDTLVIDLAGDVPIVLGIGDPDGPGVAEWLRSDAPPAKLGALEHDVTPSVRVVPRGDGPLTATTDRWSTLVAQLTGEHRRVIVDAGTGDPPATLLAGADHAWLVTRPCYLALRAAIAGSGRPTGVVLLDEPGRALHADDVAAAIGAPVVARLLLDPAVARAVDAGLLTARLPSWCRRQLGGIA